MEKPDPELVLQPADAFADGRRGDPQQAAGTAADALPSLVVPAHLKGRAIAIAMVGTPPALLALLVPALLVVWIRGARRTNT